MRETTETKPAGGAMKAHCWIQFRSYIPAALQAWTHTVGKSMGGTIFLCINDAQTFEVYEVSARARPFGRSTR